MISNQNEFKDVDPASEPALPIYIQGDGQSEDEFWPGLTKREYYAAHVSIPDSFVTKVCRDKHGTDMITSRQFMAIKAVLTVTYADALVLALQEQVE